MVEDWVNLVSNIGFPITCVVACAFFIYTNHQNSQRDSKEREEIMRAEHLERELRLSEQNDKLGETLNKATDTIDRMNIRLDLMETKMNIRLESIETKIDDLKDEVKCK